MSPGSRMCLVIDDDPAFATFLRKVAEGIGLRVRVLDDPRLLEQALSAEVPDIITLDMDMPRRHGLDVLISLANRQLADRVVIISGTPPVSMAGGTPQVAGCEIAAILEKPVRKWQIEAALSRVVENRRV